MIGRGVHCTTLTPLYHFEIYYTKTLSLLYRTLAVGCVALRHSPSSPLRGRSKSQSYPPDPTKRNKWSIGTKHSNNIIVEQTQRKVQVKSSNWWN